MYDLARIYVLLELVTPVVVKAKLFVQQISQLKLRWDDPLPEELKKRWSMFCEDSEAQKTSTFTKYRKSSKFNFYFLPMPHYVHAI